MSTKKRISGRITVKKADTIVKHKNEQPYIIPSECSIKPNREIYFKLPPNTSQWIHDEQCDDELNIDEIRKTSILESLKKIEIPEQRTPGWYKMREGKLTASDGGTALDKNEYEFQFNVILKKIMTIPFNGKKACYHGKKYEHIATMIYQYRTNVSMADFGLIGHPVHTFLGASPDGIVDTYKTDGIHKTKLVGRMLEIKVPESRNINMSSNEIFSVCPEHYWIQVQLQLECCDLDECDFWQCTINEYNSREDFINDTSSEEPFRSKTTGLEKGCLIQLIPINKVNENFSNFYDVLYDETLFIYPPKIEMTPYECDLWISSTMSSYKNNPKFRNYTIDRVIYWKLIKSRCFLVQRDKKWFAEQLPKFTQLWDMITFLRKSPSQKQLVIDYVTYALDVFKRSKKAVINEKVMTAIKMICNTNDGKYNEYISRLREVIDTYNYQKNVKIINDMFQYIEFYTQEKLEISLNNYSELNKNSIATKEFKKINTFDLVPEKIVKNDINIQKALKVIDDPSNKEHKDFIEDVSKKLLEYQKNMNMKNNKCVNNKFNGSDNGSEGGFDDGFEECC